MIEECREEGYQHKKKLDMFINSRCSKAGDLLEAMQDQLYHHKIALQVEPFGGGGGNSLFLLRRPDIEGSPETIGTFVINHPNDLVREVVLHTNSEELISQFEQKGLILSESD